MKLLSFSLLMGLQAGVVALWGATAASNDFDFGTVPMGQEIRHTFEIKNASAQPAEILRVASSCSCLIANALDKIIPPGKSARVEANLKPNKAGRMDKTILVELKSDKPSILSLRMGGLVEAVAGQPGNPDVAGAASKSKENLSSFLVNPTEVDPQSFKVDIRSAEHFQTSRIQASVNLPLYTLKSKLYLKTKPLLLIGSGFEDGVLAATASELAAAGFQAVRVLRGGILAWHQSGLSLEGTGLQQDLLALTLLDANDFEATETSSSWKVIDATGGMVNEFPGLFESLTALPFKKGSDYASRLGKVVEGHEKVLVLTEDGQGYESIANSLKATKSTPVFYLKGGASAYARHLTNRYAMRDSRSVAVQSTGGLSLHGASGSHGRMASGGCGGCK